MPLVPSAGLEAIAQIKSHDDSAAAFCSVLVVSCDRYRDLWRPFFHQFWRYWPDCPFPVYLGANTASWDDPRVSTLHAGHDESWSKSLKYFLSQISSPYVLLLLEDFFLDDAVSTNSIVAHLTTLETLGGTALRLVPNPPPDIPLKNYSEVGEIHRQALFRVSAQPGIWDRRGLMAVLRDGESAWEFEHFGTARSRINASGYFCTRISNLQCRHVVEQGKWFRSAAQHYKKLDIGCDFGARPRMGALTAIKKLVAQRLRRKETPTMDSLRVALLTNIIPPYHKPVLDCLASRYSRLRILLSTAMESNRPWKLLWDGLDVVVQKNWTLPGNWRHPGGFCEPLAVHLPLDTLAQLRRYRPNVVISAEMGMRTILAALYRRFNRRSRLIIWAEMSEITERGRGPLRALVRHVLARQADAVLAVGAGGVRYVRALDRHARVFPLLYTTDVRRFSECALTRPPKIAHRLLYAGQLIERKGLLPFLDTLAKWAAAHPERSFEFLIVGGGPLRGVLEATAVPVNLVLRFAGNVRYEDLPRIYGEAGIFVLPTLADTWGVVVNEALASGLPVLGSVRAQAVEELLADGENGWIFDPACAEQMYSALDRALSASCEQLNAMREKARARGLALAPENVAMMIDDAVAAVVKAG